MIRTLALAALSGWILACSTANGSIYTGNNNGKIYISDPLTGSAVEVSDLSIVPTDIAVNPATGLFFAISSSGLYSVDLGTSTSTLIGTGLRFSGANALVFSNDGSALYLARSNANSLYTVNTGTGVASSLGTILSGLTSSGDLEFFEGDLYWTAKGVGSTDSLVKVDLGDLASSINIGSLGHSKVYGLAGDGGVLYGILESNKIYSIDTTDASTTFVANMAGIVGLTYGASMVVPEPTSIIVWSLLGLTLGGATWWRRRRKPAA